MKIEIKVPKMGESISEAVISRMIVQNQAIIQKDQEILELETDKVNQVLYAPQAGRISFSVKTGDTVKIGQVIAIVDTENAVISKPTPSVAQPNQIVTASPNTRIFPEESLATPKDTPAIQPVAIPIAPTTAKNRKKMSSLRKAIAQRLVAVKNTTAMLTTFNEVDMSKVIAIRAKEKEAFQARFGVKLGFMSFFIKASVAALKNFPDVAAKIEGEDFVYPDKYDIGVAVSTEKGLLVPVLRDCENMALHEIEQQLEGYTKKSRGGAISLEDMQGGCFTITNGGIFGSLLSTPILNPPQSAILGMHAIVNRPIAIGDEVVVRPMMYLALSYDHRIIDGKEAVQFLVQIKDIIEDPARLLL